MLDIQIVATHPAKDWPEPRSLEMSAAIRAPREANDLTSPDQIDTNDRVEIHARGIWYPAIVVRRDPDRKFITMSGNVQHAAAAAHRLVPLGCGYSWRINSGFAEQWAAEVWRQRARGGHNEKRRPPRRRKCSSCGRTNSLVCGACSPRALQ